MCVCVSVLHFHGLGRCFTGVALSLELGACIQGWMDGWIDGWMDGLTPGGKDG